MPTQEAAATREAPVQEQTRVPSDYERERGKPMPSKIHGITQMNISFALAPYRKQYRMISEVALELGSLKVTPDLCIFPAMEVDYTEDEVHMTAPPLVAMEILSPTVRQSDSPTQSTQDLIDKIKDMLSVGVQSCWFVQPNLQLVTVFTEGMEKTTYTEGTITDPATGIEIVLDDIFQPAA